MHPLAVWDRIRRGGENQLQLLKGLPNNMVSEMYLMCAALEENFCEVLAQLASIVTCPTNCSIEKAQEVLGNIAESQTQSMQGSFWQITPVTQDVSKLKLVDQEIEQTHGNPVLDFLNKEQNRVQIALDRCVELAISDMSAANKGELPLRSRAIYGRQDLTDHGTPYTRLVSSESFLRALRHVVATRRHVVAQDLSLPGRSGFEFLEKSESMFYDPKDRCDMSGHGSRTSSSTSWALRGLVLDCIRPSSDGSMFRYTPSASMLKTFSKGWKQGPRAGFLVALPSLLLNLEPCLIGIILDNLHDVAFARMAVFVCKYLDTMARSRPEFQATMALGKKKAQDNIDDFMDDYDDYDDWRCTQDRDDDDWRETKDGYEP